MALCGHSLVKRYFSVRLAPISKILPRQKLLLRCYSVATVTRNNARNPPTTYLGPEVAPIKPCVTLCTVLTSQRPSRLWRVPIARRPPFHTRNFSTSSRNMVGTKIDGTAIAKKIRERLHADIKQTQKVNPRFKPSLKILQVGERPDSSTYVRMKLKAAEEADIACEFVHLPSSITEPELLQQIARFNNDPTVHGILVQLPLPDHLSEHTITSAVLDEKDVDGFGATNIGELAKRGGKPFFVPCTPQGVMVLLKEAGVELKGKDAVVLGRSDIVGSPVSYLLKKADATVTVCHSKTVNLPEMIKSADILVSAIGKAQFVKGEWLKPGAIVVDVGINYVPDATKKSGQRLVGD